MGVEVGSPLARQPAHPPPPPLRRSSTSPTVLFLCPYQLLVPPQYSGVNNPSGQEPGFLYSVWDE